MNDELSADDLPRHGSPRPAGLQPIDLAHLPPFRIGSVEIRPATREIVGEERRELVEPRVMEVLITLAGAQGEIMTRDDLIAACWEGRAVSEDAINRVISRLRAVARQFEAFQVETIIKVGYRLVLQAGDALPASATQDVRTRRAANQRSVCVLPFSNMSGEADQDYFSDGITEDITTDLSKVSTLGVTARNTAFTFKGQAVDICEVARSLGVSHVLEGSVRKVGNRVRINAQLVDGETGEHAWAERYDRDLTDIFAIQDEISKSIVDALKVRLLPDERRAIEKQGTGDVEAYDLYLKARQIWMTGDFGDARREQRVIRICESATRIDPDYAKAWALMGVAQANLVNAYSGYEGCDDGRAAGERALSLDPAIAEARLPKAWHLALLGRHQEASAEIDTALRLNPESWEVNKEAARIYYRQGRFIEATRLLEKAITLSDADFHSRGMLSAGYLAQGKLDQARECAQKVIEQVEAALAREPDNGAALAYGALSHAALGRLDHARSWIDRALLLDPDNLYMRYNLAWPLLAFFDDKEGAIAMLEPTLAKAGRNLVSLAAADRNLDPLREDPRFRRMLEAAKARVKDSAA